MERKNLKVYEVLLIGSVLLHWLYTVSIDKLVAKGMVTNPDVIFWTAFAISLFFFTMVIITIQALIHNLMLLQTPQTDEENKAYRNTAALVAILLVSLVTIGILGTRNTSSMTYYDVATETVAEETVAEETVAEEVTAVPLPY
jgi:hypothetical protein